MIVIARIAVLQTSQARSKDAGPSSTTASQEHYSCFLRTILYILFILSKKNLTIHLAGAPPHFFKFSSRSFANGESGSTLRSFPRGPRAPLPFVFRSSGLPLDRTLLRAVKPPSSSASTA
jgi:hypothetical protein